MRFPDFEQRLIETPIGSYPWGWGSFASERAPEGWQCRCGHKPSRRKKDPEQVLLYVNGDVVCVGCAREWCMANLEAREYRAVHSQTPD